MADPINIGDVLNRKSRQMSSETSQKSTGYPQQDERGSLKRRPMVATQKTPGKIVGAFHDELVAILSGYKKIREGAGWDEYAKRLSVDTRETMADVLSECRRNGFVNPRVFGGVLHWDYVCFHKDDKKGKTQDLCLLCERDCTRRDWKGVLVKEPCWKL